MAHGAGSIIIIIMERCDVLFEGGGGRESTDLLRSFAAAMLMSGRLFGLGWLVGRIGVGLELDFSFLIFFLSFSGCLCIRTPYRHATLLLPRFFFFFFPFALLWPFRSCFQFEPASLCSSCRWRGFFLLYILLGKGGREGGRGMGFFYLGRGKGAEEGENGKNPVEKPRRDVDVVRPSDPGLIYVMVSII